MNRATLLLFTVCVGVSGCASGDDTGKAKPADASAEKAKKPKKPGRSYEDPDSKLTGDEKTDILEICSAIVECDRRACTKGQEQVRLGAVNPKSEWGKLMVKHLNAVGRAEGGKRVARLLQQEDLKWASKDCRAVLKKYSNGYQ